MPQVFITSSLRPSEPVYICSMNLAGTSLSRSWTIRSTEPVSTTTRPSSELSPSALPSAVGGHRRPVEDRTAAETMHLFGGRRRLDRHLPRLHANRLVGDRQTPTL